MKEIDLFGVLVSPFARDLALGALLFTPLKLGLDRAGIDRLVWHRALFDVALFTCLVAGVTWGFSTGGGIAP